MGRADIHQNGVRTQLGRLGDKPADHVVPRKIVDLQAKVIADRRRLPTPDDECRLLASIGMLLMERALNQWLTAPGRGLDDIIRQEFAALLAVLK